MLFQSQVGDSCVHNHAKIRHDKWHGDMRLLQLLRYVNRHVHDDEPPDETSRRKLHSGNTQQAAWA